MSNDFVEKNIQDIVLRIVEKDSEYCELNKKILDKEKKVKEKLNDNKLYNELEELVTKSITHILFSACKKVINFHSTPYLHPIDNYKNTFIKDFLDSGQNAV